MTAQEIKEHLLVGWTLTNRGTGWYLAAPRVPYQREASQLVPDQVVTAMEQAGELSITLPYNSLIAKLTSAPEAQ